MIRLKFNLSRSGSNQSDPKLQTHSVALDEELTITEFESAFHFFLFVGVHKNFVLCVYQFCNRLNETKIFMWKNFRSSDQAAYIVAQTAKMICFTVFPWEVEGRFKNFFYRKGVTTYLYFFLGLRNFPLVK